MELLAPSHWKSVDFISDLHLQASNPLTFACWEAYLQRTQAQAVFILGDLFEVWVGDDVLREPQAFETRCSEVLAQAALQRTLYLMPGNRDFLLGHALAKASGCHLLDDPTVLVFGATRWTLSHGDALCTADHEYMEFRAMVRSERWQADFMAKPLPQRQALARQIRTASEAKKHQVVAANMDVDQLAVARLLEQTGAKTLIHGHTHQRADHVLEDGRHRLVLSDWDLDGHSTRCEVLRLHLDAQFPQPQVERRQPSQC